MGRIGWVVLAVVATAGGWTLGAAALAAPTGAAATVTLPCADQIGASSGPAASRTTVLGTVALTTRAALGAGLTGKPDPNARYFAKDGLQVRAGASFELVVPPEWRGRLSIGWGNPAQFTTRLKVAACRWMMSPSQSSPPGAWLAFAGGYQVGRPACVSVLVRAGRQQRRVHVGVGVACPGQAPPLRPPPAA